MAGTYNKCTFIGNLVRDPESKESTGGKKLTKFTIAVNKPTKEKTDPDYIRAIAWDSENNKLATNCEKYLKKGMSVLIEGRLGIGSYEKDNIKRETHEVTINLMQMLDGKGKSESENSPVSSSGSAASAINNDESDFTGHSIDEIPF